MNNTIQNEQLKQFLSILVAILTLCVFHLSHLVVVVVFFLHTRLEGW